ncbi:hypothetical protein WME94_37000 [Sorangium sp. So ce429]
MIHPWVSPGGVPKYGTSAHVKLTGVAAECSDELAAAQWRQDIVAQASSEAHFDNCAFDESIKYINALVAEANQVLSRSGLAPNDVKKGMSLIGRLLHGVQDFYSHTNYVELMHEKDAPFNEALALPIWTANGAKLVMQLANDGTLTSGVVWWGFPKKCSAQAKTHHALAKDSGTMDSGKVVLKRWQRTAYRASYQIADWATQKFLRDAYSRWPALEGVCGPVVHYLPSHDRRGP